MITIMVFHNIARDPDGRPARYDGHQPHHPLVRVFEYDTPADKAPEELAEDAFVLFNTDPAMFDHADRSLALRYRDRRLRSLDVGDVITVGKIVLEVRDIGFRRVDARNLTEVHDSEHGTVPLHRPMGERA